MIDVSKNKSWSIFFWRQRMSVFRLNCGTCNNGTSKIKSILNQSQHEAVPVIMCSLHWLHESMHQVTADVCVRMELWSTDRRMDLHSKDNLHLCNLRGWSRGCGVIWSLVHHILQTRRPYLEVLWRARVTTELIALHWFCSNVFEPSAWQGE